MDLKMNTHLLCNKVEKINKVIAFWVLEISTPFLFWK